MDFSSYMFNLILQSAISKKSLKCNVFRLSPQSLKTQGAPWRSFSFFSPGQQEPAEAVLRPGQAFVPLGHGMGSEFRHRHAPLA